MEVRKSYLEVLLGGTSVLSSLTVVVVFLALVVTLQNFLDLRLDLFVACLGQGETFHGFEALVQADHQGHASRPTEPLRELLVELHKQIQCLEHVDSQSEFAEKWQFGQSHNQGLNHGCFGKLHS